ncbi:hypothetical protein KY084_10945 [Stakelama sp. CBK3Z-3]|uniref:GIY-YIG nuclease family protein n=1 Tax=Stakelama flava TaxID=2860338 RepID=A0ABS6XMF0_9SPHN|nr:hypothetical protein [Stakelama flava]MBW4331388.1 hypothetical protein [Stakelama flava]
MTAQDRAPGWDKQAINSIAARDYGGLERMFEAHDWDAGGRLYGQIAPSRVVEIYGSVAAFEAAHPAEWPDPVDVIDQDQPDVWLTSYYGFAPESWGLLGFTQEWMRRDFLDNSRPGALVVIYGAGGAENPLERGRILGVQQQSHIRGHKRDFVPANRWADEQRDEGRRDKWNYALKAVRAWRVSAETRPRVQEFAPETYSPSSATLIGARGRRLTVSEARGLLDLDLTEVTVFGGASVDFHVSGPAREILRPSKAGPVSQAAFMTRESEGPKHLYILALEGNADHFLGHSAEGNRIVKVGFSRSPDTRCYSHNCALPAGAFRWSVLRSSAKDRSPFPSSSHALAGEKVMKNLLDQHGSSLGREFFLASDNHIENAWNMALAAAETWKSE